MSQMPSEESPNDDPEMARSSCPSCPSVALVGRHVSSLTNPPPVVLRKRGVEYELSIHGDHTTEEVTTDTTSSPSSPSHSRTVRVLGGACSELFSGPRLARILQPCIDLQQQAIDALRRNEPAPTLSVHTSVGQTPALNGFIEELTYHLPRVWGSNNDWVLSLQLEGTSAVHAGVDLLMQLQHLRGRTHLNTQTRVHVAVADASYHGPPTTGYGHSPTLPTRKWPFTPVQYLYPAPTAFSRWRWEASLTETDPPPTTARWLAFVRTQFQDFLETHHQDIAVLIVEPQWGSSVAGMPWDVTLLRDVIDMAHAKGILVLADEIMCGLARHGQGGRTFLSDAWNLPVDGITFGKAIASGVYPLSGVVLREGRQALNQSGRTVMQSHTYAHGAHTLPLLAATQTLHLLRTDPTIHTLIQQGATVCREELSQMIESLPSSEAVCHGQGLMWGVLWAHPERDMLGALEQWRERGVVVYRVGVGGGMVTPVVDGGW